MNPTIRPTKVLDYYDGVLVFTAEGDDGQQYVGSIIDTTDGIDRYLVKATTPERIKDLEKDKVDLRSLLLENPSDDWFLTSTGTHPTNRWNCIRKTARLKLPTFFRRKSTS